MIFRQKTKIKKNSGGFSLLELIVYIGILGIIAVVVADVFLLLNKSRGQVEAKTEVNNNIRFALESIKRDITMANALLTPAATSSASSSLQLQSGGSTVTYCLVSGRLRRQSGGACTAASDAITGERVTVSNVQFSRTENFSPSFGTKTVAVIVDLRIDYNGAAAEWQYGQDERLTAALRSDL